ncbi:MAG: hypothetical protein ACXV1K_11760 [Kineosporiaceae bacterium]
MRYPSSNATAANSPGRVASPRNRDASLRSFVERSIRYRLSRRLASRGERTSGASDASIESSGSVSGVRTTATPRCTAATSDPSSTGGATGDSEIGGSGGLVVPSSPGSGPEPSEVGPPRSRAGDVGWCSGSGSDSRRIMVSNPFGVIAGSTNGTLKIFSR